MVSPQVGYIINSMRIVSSSITLIPFQLPSSISNSNNPYVRLDGMNEDNHLRTLGFVWARCMIISPKKELAQANHSLVICVGLSTEKDSCMRSFFADLTKLLKQFRISLFDLDVRIWIVRANGQMYLGSVWELPTPLMSPLAQKYLFFSDKMNLRVLRQMASSSSTNFRQAKLSKHGKLESSQSRQFPSPSTSQAKINSPDYWTIPYSKILPLMREECYNMRSDSFQLHARQTDPEGTWERTSFATNQRQLEIIALPGMLQGSSLGLSDGRKPVLIIPVQTAFLMTPPGSYQLLRLKEQYGLPNFRQKAES